MATLVGTSHCMVLGTGDIKEEINIVLYPNPSTSQLVVSTVVKLLLK